MAAGWAIGFVSLLLVLVACAQPLHQELLKDAGPVSAVNEVWLVNHGWHTGLVVAAENLNQRLPVLRQRFPAAQYYEVGWGDQEFYPAGEASSGLALRALLYSSGSVLHLVGFTGRSGQVFTGLEQYRLCLNEAGYGRLLDYVAATFLRGGSQEIVALGRGLYGDSQFYRARGQFSWRFTCNSWTAVALRQAGLAVPELTTASTLMAVVAEIEAQQLHRTPSASLSNESPPSTAVPRR